MSEIKIKNYLKRFKGWSSRKKSLIVKLSFFFVLIHLLIIGIIYLIARINPFYDFWWILPIIDFPVAGLVLTTTGIGTIESYILLGSISYGILGAFIGSLISKRKIRIKTPKAIKEITPRELVFPTLIYGILASLFNLGWWLIFTFGYAGMPLYKYAKVALLVDNFNILAFCSPIVGGIILIIGSFRFYFEKERTKAISIIGILLLMISPIWTAIIGCLISNDYGLISISKNILVNLFIFFIPIILPGCLVIRKIKNSHINCSTVVQRKERPNGTN